MKIERKEVKETSTQDGADDEIEGGQDRRRARMADLLRLETAITVATAKVEALEALLAKSATEPVNRSQFYANFFASATLAGIQKPGVVRDRADLAWATYLEALAGTPRRSIEEREAPVAAAPAMLPAVGRGETTHATLSAPIAVEAKA